MPTLPTLAINFVGAPVDEINDMAARCGIDPASAAAVLIVAGATSVSHLFPHREPSASEDPNDKMIATIERIFSRLVPPPLTVHPGEAPDPIDLASHRARRDASPPQGQITDEDNGPQPWFPSTEVVAAYAAATGEADLPVMFYGDGTTCACAACHSIVNWRYYKGIPIADIHPTLSGEVCRVEGPFRWASDLGAIHPTGPARK